MPRSFGRVLASIWEDEDFRTLASDSRLVYLFLLSQPDLDHAGLIPLRERRWGRALAFSAPEVSASLKDLSAARFTVMDEDTEELLVRSLIRRDEIWKQPNVFKSACASAIAAQSPRIKAALYIEVRRLELNSASHDVRRIRDELLTLLEPFGNPSPTPPEPSSTGSSASGPESGERTESATSGETSKSAGQNPSATLPEPFPTGSSELRGKGSGYGPVPLVSPSPFPIPPPPDSEPGSDPRPLWPLAVVGDRTEEGDRDQGQSKDQLVTAVRRIRSDWSTKSIERALDADAVTDRPWELVRAAMLAVARDPESKQPGRLAHDGPWWALAPVRNLPPLEANQRHGYEPDSDEGCVVCGLPASNRRHQESA